MEEKEKSAGDGGRAGLGGGAVPFQADWTLLLEKKEDGARMSVIGRWGSVGVWGHRGFGLSVGWDSKIPGPKYVGACRWTPSLLKI